MRRLLATLGAVTLASATIAGPAAAAVDDPARLPDDVVAAQRLEGPNRYATAAALAVDAHPAGADTVIIARGTDFPDALAAAYLAGVEDAPVLLTLEASLPQETLDALDVLGPTEIVLLGGPVAISTDVEAALAAEYGEDNVTRIEGANRFDTAVQVALAGDGRVGLAPDLSGGPTPLRTAIVALGTNFPDALAAGPLAAGNGHPILLVGPDFLPTVTRFALEDATLDIEQVIVAGGSAAVSDDVVGQIAALPNIRHVERVDGTDRFATAAAMGELTRAALGWDGSAVALAVATNFPDALALAPVAAGRQASLLLSATDTVRAPTFAAVQDVCTTVTSLLVTGGTAAISTAAEHEAELATSCADLTFAMSGAQETRGGDSDAAGTGWLWTTSLCYALTVTGLDEAVTGAHVHEAPAGEDGPVVADLHAPPGHGFVAGCLDDGDVRDGTRDELAAAIAADPTGYYVNLHTGTFEQGAVRGQLAD